MSADQTNSAGISCKRGHVGKWRSSKQGKTKVCRSCEQEWARAKNYGLSGEAFAALAAEQCGRCACCHRHSLRLVVDHDHVSGRVRALLCDGCNQAVGVVESGRASIALDYLDRIE